MISNNGALLYRLAPDGIYAATDAQDQVRVLYSDPFEVPRSGWDFGRKVDLNSAVLLPPLRPSKIVGIGRNYQEHARELGNPVPQAPVLFLKSPTSVIGPGAPIVLPPESQQVEYEGEIAVVLRGTLRRASWTQAKAAILGITCACDVTARDLQRQDPTFARAKSFDTFCPLGPALWLDPELEDLRVTTRLNGTVVQEGHVAQMSFGILELLVYTSTMMTLEPGDVLLTGTPAGVGVLRPGDCVEVEIPGVGALANPVTAWQR